MWRFESLEFKLMLGQHGLHKTLSQMKQGKDILLHQTIMIKNPTIIGTTEKAQEVLEDPSLGSLSTQKVWCGHACVCSPRSGGSREKGFAGTCCPVA